MTPNTNIVAAIPARLASTRLPRKVLLDLGGKPVVRRVWEKVTRMKTVGRVVILADSEEVADVARGFGAEVLTTDPACASGTERLASVLGALPGDFFLNVQGDEPFIDPALLDALVERWRESRCRVVTAVARVKHASQLSNPNTVKVVRAVNGRAVYFSRSPVPHLRGAPLEEWPDRAAYWSHIGVYGYDRDTLAEYAAMPVTDIERIESLEQLRFVEHGLDIRTVETEYHPVAIDTAEDLERARALFAAGTVS